MRVLHVLDAFNFGGAENLIVELARYGSPEFDLSVASLAPVSKGENAFLPRFYEASVEPVHFNVKRLIDAPGVADMARQLRTLRPDVVHAHLEYASTLVPLAARAAGIPVVATIHHEAQPDLSASWRFRERLALRVPAAAGRVAFVSSRAMQSFQQRHGGSTKNWRVVHNGVDLSRYRPRSESDRSSIPGVPSGEQAWVKVAALRERKGFLDAVNAWSEVVRTHPTAHLVLAGEGEMRPQIEARIKTLGIQRNVHMLGLVDDVPSLLASCQGAISASWTEALPTAVIEAASTGLPIVATNVGGTDDIIEHGKSGFLVPAHNARSLAKHVNMLICDEKMAARFGAAAREDALSRFDMPVWVRNLKRLYEEVI